MRTWTKRDPVKNYFPLPNEIYQLGLSHSAIAVYGYLLRIEDRRTYQCHPSYATIGKAVGMSRNTVRKYVQVGGTRAHPYRAHQHHHAGRAQAKRKSALHDPADPVFHRPVLSAADGCCGQSKGTAASGKTHGADQRVKPASIFLCMLLSWPDKTVKPIGAVRETAMGSRSPAGPRRLETATHMSTSLFRRLSAFFGSTPDQGPKAAKFAVLTPGHAGFPNRAKRSEGSDTTPRPKRPCFAV